MNDSCFNVVLESDSLTHLEITTAIFKVQTSEVSTDLYNENASTSYCTAKGSSNSVPNFCLGGRARTPSQHAGPFC